MKKSIGLIVVLGLLSAPAVFAANNGSGCGLGKTLFEGQKGMVPNILAAIINGISSNNVFAITSGTSGCDADSVVLQEKEQEVFVAVNLDNLSQDMAQGDGMYLQALSGLMGCTTEAFGTFAELAQDKYEVLFDTVDANAAGLLSGLKRELAAHPTLNTHCDRIS